MLHKVCQATQGVRGKVEDVDIGKSLQRLQVLVFYESDWDPSSLLLMTQFSKLKDQLLANNCSLYGCSTDTVATHLQWIKVELGGQLNFPLISDPAGVLADKFSLFDNEERLCHRGVVVVNSKGEPLETIVSGLGEEELAKLTLKVVLRVPKPSHILESCSASSSNKSPTPLQTNVLSKTASTLKEKRPFYEKPIVGRSGRVLVHEKKSQMQAKQEKEGVEDHSSPVMRQAISRTEQRLIRGFF